MMRWKSLSSRVREFLDQRTLQMTTPHRWFAWHPVRIHGTDMYIWLEYVTRYYNFSVFGSAYSRWIYPFKEEYRQ